MPLFLAAGCTAIIDFPRGELDDAGTAQDASEPSPDAPFDGTLAPDAELDAVVDGPAPDVTVDAPMDAPMDAAMDAVTDAPLDAAMDAMADVGMDADAAEAGPDADAEPACDPETHAGCEPHELCCDGPAGLECVATDPAVQCSVCGEACDSRTANSCVERTCLCGDAACTADAPVCDTSADSCVECLGDEDCDGSAAGEFCAEGMCVECDRGADPDDAADDRGCSGATPICGSDNTCQGCSDSPEDCPGDLYCVPGEGCFGCDPDAPPGENGCAAATPVCELEGGVAQCVPCSDDASCMDAYCDEPPGGGACYATCDPDDHAGCDDPTEPLCRIRDGSASCVPCYLEGAPSCPGDLRCVQSSLDAGRCVECLDNADCSGDAPICDPLTRTCRGCTELTEAIDCPGASPACDEASGQCVECRPGNTSACSDTMPVCGNDNACRGCLQNTECSDLSTPACASSGECVECTASETSACTGETDLCATASNRCVECLSDGDCGGSTPLCDMDEGTCVTCTHASVDGDGDARCEAKLERSECNTATGACVCDVGFTGAQCSACETDHYGPSCQACACAAGEQCDDGRDGDGTCSTCGDGDTEGAESCDDNNALACGQCNASCSGPGTGSTCAAGVGCADAEDCASGTCTAGTCADGGGAPVGEQNGRARGRD